MVNPIDVIDHKPGIFLKLQRESLGQDLDNRLKHLWRAGFFTVFGRFISRRVGK